jgi:hypothetical protein
VPGSDDEHSPPHPEKQRRSGCPPLRGTCLAVSWRLRSGTGQKTRSEGQLALTGLLTLQSQPTNLFAMKASHSV